MDIDRSKIPANKVYEKHSKGVVATGLLSLVVLALVLGFFFLPIVAYFPNGGERVDMTGLNLICYSLRSLLKGANYNAGFDRFVSSVQSYSGQNGLFYAIAQNQPTIELVVMTFFFISVLFTLVVVIYGLVFLLRGHIKSTLMVSALSHSVASFASFFVLLLFLYLLLCRKMFIECNILDHIRFYITPFILIIALFTTAFILSGIYRKCFKKRVYILDYKPKQTEESEENIDGVDLVKAYISNFPNGTTSIADDAFQKNTEITVANIPEGITYVGLNCFSNCLNLEKVIISASVTEFGANCFFNTPKLQYFVFKGTMDQWKEIYKGSNWNKLSGAEYVETSDGKLVLK